MASKTEIIQSAYAADVKKIYLNFAESLAMASTAAEREIEEQRLRAALASADDALARAVTIVAD